MGGFPKRAFVRSFGCRASQADGSALESSLRAAGLAVVSEGENPDLIVLNTCTVTHSADVDARRLVRATHRDHPGAQILVTGCYAQRAPEELLALEGVRWVVGNSHKATIAELVSEPYHGAVGAGQIVHSAFGQSAAFAAPVLSGIGRERTRPNLKVQDGCNNRCSFCIIPSVRGPSRSADLTTVIGQLKTLSEHYREIVLTGINLGRWGRDLPGRPRFTQLLLSILEQTTVARLRISSVEPMDWSEDLFELMASSNRIAQHVHMPLQSGSDAVLKRMKRRYRLRHYASRLAMARQFLPDAAIGADVMTGFPGETDEDFEQTFSFVEEQPFTYLHVFTYSERPGTEAEKLPDRVPIPVRKQRTDRLRALSERKQAAFARTFLGRTLSAITLEEPGMALSSNYLRVQMREQRPAQQLIELLIGGAKDDLLREQSSFPVLN